MCGMVQGVQDATSAQEEQGLEEGMREQVKHARAGAISATSDTQPDKHIAKLADGGKCQDALEVPLAHGNRSGKESGECAYPGDDLERLRPGGGKEGEGACHHVDTCGHHSSGMNESADRRWAFHSGWQPDMQREL